MNQLTESEQYSIVAALRVAAQKYSGRRGWLDSAADAIARGLKVLDEVQAWETRRKVA